MTTATKARPRRDVSETKLPLTEKGDIDLVAVLVEALLVPGRLSQCYNKFHRYSFLNIVLAYMQTGKLEPMATFNKWKSLDRKVISGPGSALFINHPRFAPDRDENGAPRLDEKGKPVMKIVGFYPKATVFQMFQTEGPELTMPEMPDWDKQQALEALDITEVPFAHHDGNTQGYSVERRFAINPVAEAPFKTMVHELAHILCGHTDSATDISEHPRGVQEFQAEAVALLVCTELDVEGFDAASSRAYIQGWLRGEDSDYIDEHDNLLVDNKIVRQVFSVADKIMTAGRSKHYNKMKAAEDAEQAAKPKPVRKTKPRKRS